MRDLVKLNMLGGGFGPSLADNSGIDAAPTLPSNGGASVMILDDSQPSSSTISENEVVAAETNSSSCGQLKNVGEKCAVTEANSIRTPAKIYASGLPCHDHLTKAISIS